MSYPQNNYKNYHAHIYFNKQSQALAVRLHAHASSQLGLVVGKVNLRPVGPHIDWSFSIEFDHDEFDIVIPWLDEARQNLSVLVHAVTDNEYQDHTEYAYWLGEPVPLKLSIFKN